ncbi:MAG: FAD-dependent oxidoreductase [Syntrophaceae bacterium]
MKSFDYDLGILGGGAAGLTAASGAAQFGAKTLLIEKADKLGGDCLHYGCVPSKTLIRSAGVYALARRFPAFGLPGLDLPPVDLGAVMDRVARVIAQIQAHDSPERFCRLGALVRFGAPSFVDPHSVTLDGEVVTAKSWIIATGSRPAVPPVAGLSDVPFWTNETVFSQRSLPRRLIVLGGGPIGLELAQAFGRLGASVTVVEFMDQILGIEDADIAAILQGRLVEEGITILTATKAVSAAYDGGVFRLSVTPAVGGGDLRTLEAEALLVAAGRKPNIEGLGLEAAGVAYTPRGITTDKRLRTTGGHIYACGDVNGLMPFTHVAGYEAGIALTNAVLHLPRRADYERIGWCTYTDPEVAGIGLSEKAAAGQGLSCRVIEEAFESNDRALAEGEAKGKLKLLVGDKGTVLGVRIIGPRAGELMHEWVVALAAKVKLSTMAGAVHVYPTLSEISKRAAGDYYSDKLFKPATKEILRLLFSLKGRACEAPEDSGP